MDKEFDFFFIEIKNLKSRKTFPFQLYIYNPRNHEYSLFLNGNQPLSKEIESLLKELCSTGAQLAVPRKQSRTFLKAQEYSIDDFPALAKTSELHQLEKEQLMYQKLKEIYDDKEGAFIFKSHFEQALDNNDFSNLIHYAKLEILTFGFSTSHTVSLAVFLAKDFLNEDNYLNRIVALSYFLTKNNNIKDVESLSDVVCGAFLSQIGITQLPYSVIEKSFNHLSEVERDLYKKHTLLGSHFIKKSHLQLSDRCKKIIEDHHERISGEGYPAMKAGDSIDTLSSIVGCVYHLFEFSSGKINGNRQTLRSIIVNVKRNNYVSGLDMNFDQSIVSSLTSLIELETIKNKKVA